MELHTEQRGAPAFERRRERRVRLTVPVEISWQEKDDGAAASCVTAQSVDLSAAGVSCTFNGQGRFLPGEVLRISLRIPANLRAVIPFSRMGGASRVVRAVAQQDGVEVAFAFCVPGVLHLASIVHP